MAVFGKILLYAGVAVIVLVAVIIGYLCLLAIRNRRGERRWQDASPDARDRHTVHDERLATALRNPSWSEYQQRLGTPPQALLDLYANAELILSQDFSFKLATSNDAPEYWHIHHFMPPSESFASPYYTEQLTRNDFLFAVDGMGNSYFICLQDFRDHQGPVYFYDHDRKQKSVIADTLATFTSAERVVTS